MVTLLNKYPNFKVAIESIKADTDLKFISSNDYKIKYMMSLIAFNNKLGDIVIELNKFNSENDEFVILTFSTLNGKKIEASTQSKFIKNDLSTDNWLKLINELMINHNSNPDHQKVAMSFLNKKVSNSRNENSGCVLVLGITFITLLIYFF